MEIRSRNKKLFIVAGELSGDNHGAKLISALKSIQPGIEINGIGGDLMIHEGMNAFYHIKQLSFLGIGEVIRHLPFILKVHKQILQNIKSINPDAVILIDYPGFNLRLARAVKKMGIPVTYYISPQLWAWGKRRVKKIRRFVDKMLVIFPFEVDFYNQYGIEAVYVGHPLVDRYFRFINPKKTNPDSERILGILPGSRKQELEKLLPDMIDTAQILIRKNIIDRAVIARVDTVSLSTYKQYIKNDTCIEIFQGEMVDFYNQLDAAIVTSGTATLETSYFRVPMIIVYRVGFLTWILGKCMVKLDRIGLANIVAEKEIAVELIQRNFKPDRAAGLIEELLDPLKNAEVREKMNIISDRLGHPGASIRAAQLILKKGKE